MDFTLQSSLHHRASVAIVFAVWSHEEINNFTTNSNDVSENDFKPWGQLEKKVAANIDLLPLPLFAKKNLLNFVQPLGQQIVWCISSFSFFNTDLYTKFCFTSHGTMDRKRTANHLLRCGNLSLINQYRLACTYCLVSLIYKLWPEVRDHFSPKISDNSIIHESIEVAFWSCFLEDRVDKLMYLTDYHGGRFDFEFALCKSLDFGNETAFKYFLGRIQPERKSQAVTKLSRRIVEKNWICNKPDLLVFLLSHMTKAQQHDLFTNYSFGVLKCFLNWPWQELFMNLASTMWTSLSEMEYCNLLEDIVRKISEYDLDFTFNVLLNEFWEKSPQHHRNYVISKCIDGIFLSRLIILKGTDDCVKLLLHTMNSEQKCHMIFGFEGKNMCACLVVKARWESLKMLIKECIPSKSLLEKFRDEYTEHVKICPYLSSKTYLNAFLEFLKDLM